MTSWLIRSYQIVCDPYNFRPLIIFKRNVLNGREIGAWLHLFLCFPCGQRMMQTATRRNVLHDMTAFAGEPIACHDA